MCVRVCILCVDGWVCWGCLGDHPARTQVSAASAGVAGALAHRQMQAGYWGMGRRQAGVSGALCPINVTSASQSQVRPRDPPLPDPPSSLPAGCGGRHAPGDVLSSGLGGGAASSAQLGTLLGGSCVQYTETCMWQGPLGPSQARTPTSRTCSASGLHWAGARAQSGAACRTKSAALAASARLPAR